MRMMRVIKLHLSEVDVLVLSIRNCDCGVEGCVVGMILPGEGGRVDVSCWIGQKRRETLQQVLTVRWCQNQFVCSYTVSCSYWESCSACWRQQRRKILTMLDLHKAAWLTLLSETCLFKHEDDESLFWRCYWCSLFPPVAQTMDLLWAESIFCCQLSIFPRIGLPQRSRCIFCWTIPECLKNIYIQDLPVPNFQHLLTKNWHLKDLWTLIDRT